MKYKVKWGIIGLGNIAFEFAKSFYNADNAESYLASKGILVRGMKVYGLSNYLRVSIGTEEENIKFINELKTFFRK